MSKNIYLLLMVILLPACAEGYSSRVAGLSNNELCKNLGKYTLYQHTEGISLTRGQIQQRTMDKKQCESLANSEISRLSPGYKLKLCQHLAAYHYKGAYKHFARTLNKIEQTGFADKECETMADFYYIRLARRQEKAQAISNALNQAAENIRKNNELLYGPGTYFNPIHVKIQ